jgi:hypothetical protein
VSGVNRHPALLKNIRGRNQNMRSKKQKLISDTGTGTKIVINLDIAEKVLSKSSLTALKAVLKDLYDAEKS